MGGENVTNKIKQLKKQLEGNVWNELVQDGQYTALVEDINIEGQGEGQLMTMKEKVLAYINNEKVTLHFDAEGVLKTDDYTFSSEGNKTKVTLNATYQAESYILGCIFPYFKGTFRGIDEKYLNNFKVYLEKQ